MVGYAGSPTYTAYVDMTLTRSKVKVKVTGLLNFRQLAKPYMLAAMTAAPLRGFLVKKWTHSSVSVDVNVTSLWYFPSLEINRFHFGAYVMLPLLHYYLGKLKSLQYALLNSLQS